MSNQHEEFNPRAFANSPLAQFLDDFRKAIERELQASESGKNTYDHYTQSRYGMMGRGLYKPWTAKNK